MTPIQQLMLGAGAAKKEKYWYNLCTNTITKSDTQPFTGANSANMAGGWSYTNDRYDGLSFQISGTGTFRFISMGHGSINNNNTSGTTLGTNIHLTNGTSVMDTMLWQITGNNFTVGNDQNSPHSFNMVTIPTTGDSGYGDFPTLTRGAWYTLGWNAPSGHGSYTTAYRNAALTPTSGSGDNKTGIKTFDHKGETVTWYVKKPTFPSGSTFIFNGTSVDSGQMQGVGIEID